jgi:hypothetical protein
MAWNPEFGSLPDPAGPRGAGRALASPRTLQWRVNVERSSRNAVLESYKRGVDRTLLRQKLNLTPDECVRVR